MTHLGAARKGANVPRKVSHAYRRIVLFGIQFRFACAGNSQRFDHGRNGLQHSWAERHAGALRNIRAEAVSESLCAGAIVRVHPLRFNSQERQVRA
eukprot:882937-Rhodomonas_salina.3